MSSHFISILISFIQVFFQGHINNSIQDFRQICFTTGNRLRIFIGYLTGSIAKGLRRGIIASSLVVIVVLLIWILLSIFSGQDLMALFQGTQLTETLGGIFSAFIGVLIGGVVGGLVSGPYEEF